MGMTSTQNLDPDGHNTEDSTPESLSVNRWLRWRTQHWRTVFPEDRMLTRSRSLTLMTLTQRTLWAEFIWAKRLYKKKNPWLSWHLHRRLRGQNSYGRTLTWRKNTAVLTSTRKYHGQKSLWAKRLHKKKTPDSYDANTEDIMGRIPMGETLAQGEKPWLSWHRHRRLHGQNSYGRSAHMKKIPNSYDVNT